MNMVLDIAELVSGGVCEVCGNKGNVKIEGGLDAGALSMKVFLEGILRWFRFLVALKGMLGQLRVLFFL